MVNINYYYRSIRATSALTVRMRIVKDGKRISIEGKTQKLFEKKYWEKYHNNLKIRDYAMKVIQNESHKHLNDLTLFLQKAFSNTTLGKVNKDWLDEQIDLFYNPQLAINIPLVLVDYISYFLNIRKNSIGSATVKKYQTLNNKINAFILKRGKTIKMEDINENLKIEFEDFLIHQEYSKGTISRDIGFLKTLCIHAYNQGLDINRQALKIKTKKEIVDSSDIIYLKEEELRRIKMLKNLPEHLERTRQWLIISCFTGQRISDFMRFERDMINLNRGKKIIQIKQKKGRKNVSIPIFPPVEEILEKNEGNFPKEMAHQKYNEHLKTLCKIANLNEIMTGKKLIKKGPKKYRKIKGYYPKHEIVSSHIGRRSFATLFYPKMKLPLLMSITGHSTESMLLRYIGKSTADYAIEAYNSYDLDF